MFGLILSWFGGIFFLLIGIVSVIDNDLLPAIPVFMIAFLFLPPIRKFAYSKLNLKLPFIARVVSIFILLLIAGHMAGQSQQKKNTEYFSRNAPEVLGEIRSLIKSEDYKAALLQTEKYMASGNKEIIYLHSIVKDKIEEEKKKDAYASKYDSGDEDFSTKGLSCYEIGYKYGKCATLVLKGGSCSASDDIVVPKRCRGVPEKDRGIVDGTKSVY